MNGEKFEDLITGRHNTHWPPGFLILDTNVIKRLFKGGFQRSYAQLIDDYKARGFTPVVPRMVQIEMLKAADSFKEYNDVERYLDENFEIWPMTDEVFHHACYLHFLYQHEHKLKSYTNDNPRILYDLIVGAFVADFQLGQVNKEPWKTAYLLSEDTRAFHEPYFLEVESHTTTHKNGKAVITARRFRFGTNDFNRKLAVHSLADIFPDSVRNSDTIDSVSIEETDLRRFEAMLQRAAGQPVLTEDRIGELILGERSYSGTGTRKRKGKGTSGKRRGKSRPKNA